MSGATLDEDNVVRILELTEKIREHCDVSHLPLLLEIDEIIVFALPSISRESD